MNAALAQGGGSNSEYGRYTVIQLVQKSGMVVLGRQWLLLPISQLVVLS